MTSAAAQVMSLSLKVRITTMLVAIAMAYGLIWVIGVGQALSRVHAGHHVYSPLFVVVAALLFLLLTSFLSRRGFILAVLVGMAAGYLASVISYCLSGWYSGTILRGGRPWLHDVELALGLPLYLGGWILGLVVGLIFRVLLWLYQRHVTSDDVGGGKAPQDA